MRYPLGKSCKGRVILLKSFTSDDLETLVFVVMVAPTEKIRINTIEANMIFSFFVLPTF